MGDSRLILEQYKQRLTELTRRMDEIDDPLLEGRPVLEFLIANSGDVLDAVVDLTGRLEALEAAEGGGGPKRVETLDARVGELEARASKRKKK